MQVSGEGNQLDFRAMSAEIDLSEVRVPVSLCDFDDSKGLVVTTPRSLKACSKIGILPHELLRPELSDTVEEMKREKENFNDHVILKMRHAFRIQMQQRKLKSAVEAYWAVCEDEALTPIQLERDVSHSTKILTEEKQLKKIVETNKSRLRQQLLKNQLIQKQREREDEALAAQRQLDTRKKEEMVRLMCEKSCQEEAAASLRNKARELEQKEMAQAAEAVRLQQELQDSLLRQRMEERRRELDEINLQKRQRNRERRERMKLQSELLASQRREELQSRMSAFEQEHQARMRQKEIEHARKRSEAHARAMKIQEAINRSHSQLQAKILMTETKEAAVEERLHEFAEERRAKRKAMMEDELEKEAKRQETHIQAVAGHQQRVQKFVEKMNSNEDRHKILREQKEHQKAINHELAKQRVLMKQDAVNRQKRVDEEERKLLEEKVESKTERIVEMKQHDISMKQQRKHHREEAERTRVKLSEVTPGPGDYVIIDGDCGTNAPKWKMGLPASTQGPRVVLKNQPVPGYNYSPGPAAYRIDNVDESRHRKRSAFSFPKATRFDYQENDSFSTSSRSPSRNQ